MSITINTGLLAYGMSGKVFHAPFIAAHTGFTFRAVTERNRKLAQADYPSVISYPSVEELLADPAIDLVIVNTPNFTHFDYAKKALEAGKHILVEKPFTATRKQAEELFELARSVNRKALVYQNRRYDSGYQTTKKVLESGRLGKLTEVHFRFDRYRNEIGPKSFKEEPVAASGLLYDLGPHLIDQAISLFGIPLKFHKTLARHRLHTQVDDYFSIQLNYPNELQVFLTASMLVAEIKDAFVINGMNGSFSKPHGDVQEGQLLKGMKPGDAGYGIEDPADAGRLTVVTAEGGRTREQPEAISGNYMGLFDDLYQTLVNEVPFPIRNEEVLAQLDILED